MYPTTALVAPLTADRLREAETSRAAHAAGRLRLMVSRWSRPVRAQITGLAVRAAADRANGANDHVAV